MSAQDLADDEIPVLESDRLRFERYDALARGWGAVQAVVKAPGEQSASADPRVLRLATIRSHDQYDTRVVFMNEEDMRRRGIAIGARVEIESVTKDGRRRLVRNFVARSYDIPSGSVAAYYAETNPLLPLGYHAPKSKTPAAKSIPVFVRAMATT